MTACEATGAPPARRATTTVHSPGVFVGRDGELASSSPRSSGRTQAWLDAVLENPDGPDLDRYLEVRFDGDV